MCLQDPAYVSIRQHTSAYVCTEVQHTLGLRACLQEAAEREEHVIYIYNTRATSAPGLNLQVSGALSSMPERFRKARKLVSEVLSY
jgi:hypothetical protein